MRKLDRTLLLLAIVLQVVMLARVGIPISVAHAFMGDSPPELERWYSKADSWQDAAERMTRSLNEWADGTYRWNQNVARRLDDIEQRLATLEAAKAPVTKKAAKKR